MAHTLRQPTVPRPPALFVDYVDSIHDLTRPSEPISCAQWQEKLAACLDGEPGQVLRERVTQSELRRQGAFFTGAKLARRVANTAFSRKGATSTYFDPACGAGDLLLAIASRLPVEPTFPGTLDTWGTRLGGCDISSAFVRLTKARLTLLAAKRSRVRPPFDPAMLVDAFPNIVVGDSLDPSRRLPDPDVIVMNPPFGYAAAPDDCDWAQGRVNHAALFVNQVIRDVSDGTRITAILPDVLRSGSRYVAWREKTRASGNLIGQIPLGLFDQRTDVDVYLFHFEKRTRPYVSCGKLRSVVKPTYGVGKRFAVHVGPVVPHRHAEVGPLVQYIHARSIPPWSECNEIAETRRFAGRLFTPPFVTVRRTSRPDSGQRAIATLALGNHPVAVENHLIVLVPEDRTVQTCRQLMQRLRSPRTDAWLNARLRCRHLTTRALAEMPWWRKP